jgi:large subunit ribosomal protein L1
MKSRSKRFKNDLQKVDPNRQYSLDDAIGLLKRFNTTKFDQTVDLAVKLNVDPRKSDQVIRGSVTLPSGIGKARKVIVFADGQEAEIARQAGADEVGGEELVKRIQDGWTGFDIAISIPRMMKHVGKLGKILGPQGKMPSPKTGTVTEDVKTAVKEFKAGKIEFRTDSGGNVHVPVGKLSFAESDLKQNIRVFLDYLRHLRPATVRGTFIRGVCLSASMSPGIRLFYQER